MLKGFIETKQVSTRSKQVYGGSTGINAWNTFALRVEYPYIVRKLEESLDMSEPTFHAEKTACYQLQQQTKVQTILWPVWTITIHIARSKSVTFDYEDCSDPNNQWIHQ